MQGQCNQFLSHETLGVLGSSLLDSGLQRDEHETGHTDPHIAGWLLVPFPSLTFRCLPASGFHETLPYYDKSSRLAKAGTVFSFYLQ